MPKKEAVEGGDPMVLAESVSAAVNVSLKAMTGAAQVALVCQPCGRFLGYEHDKPKDVCEGGKDDPHEPHPATRMDADSVRVDPTTKLVVAGREIPKPDDPEALEKQAAELLARAKAARQVGDKT